MFSMQNILRPFSPVHNFFQLLNFLLINLKKIQGKGCRLLIPEFHKASLKGILDAQNHTITQTDLIG